ncbi:polyprenol monophosphomannose synthase [Tuwongella immobilis]|uniref:Glycosyltransferase 2-like domain-containing protein n=1 Tax=Tuwongella immobilis TaxID=692036 RepID=A0A6C2YS71_9BACT|nr:polyprenol monophosphomannose synthase [Tuwongella immobilis]VIP04194.1 dolichyl-phosphate beta-d-mannosyltransferase : Dolichyl-phosphate beta-D-mannosyltransferase OS=Isosphaera pallida (strain ATCC 43644 / DSM 9630 / IS1B) GN=Isop_2484 PE=4 SV=1: Glycos_transf_2 [Tuwongella immobilis]VTS05752.1 dolichyl-phosphate beta-d-mannosyltransferase : Dolichyl-phosphate beta-D-mannosyltransferase OS=Isosphaera pallida (strain ATCC 43644 / DSM 9630 / IS1B) GN=Isop_2484 PE=4 SV=1: Glycos_transf_2 [Tuwo
MQAGTSPTQSPLGAHSIEPIAPLIDGRLLVALATYNERDNLQRLIEEIQQQVPTADVLVIDDNSPDGTGQLADAMRAKDSRIQVIHRPGKLGLGTALIAAMRHAMEHQYDYIQIMDADFSHPPRYLPGILAGMKQFDVMIGSRYVAGGGTENWPWMRRFISQSVNRMVRTLMRMPVRDASGAFRCYRIAKVREINFDRIRSRGYSFQQEVLFRCYQVGCKLGEYPIIFENRRAGASKVNFKEALRSISMLLFIGIRNVIGLEKPKDAKLPPQSDPK